MCMKIKSVGIIGFGPFAKLLAEILQDASKEIKIYSRSRVEDLPNYITQENLSEVVSSDFTFLAVPFEAYGPVLEQIKPHVSQSTILVDVCSVKLSSVEKIKQVLPDIKLIASHPLFGPESSTSDKRRIVVCSQDSDPEALVEFRRLLKQLNLEEVNITADEHDKQMAQVHALTFFIAQGLIDLKLPEPNLPTGFYQSLQRLIDIQSKHTAQLTNTIERHNPYAKDMRKKLIKSLANLDKIYS